MTHPQEQAMSFLYSVAVARRGREGARPGGAAEEGQGRVGKGCGIIIIIIGISSLPSGVVICLVLFFMVLFFTFKCVNIISFWVFTNPKFTF